jgi:hypothetical protein
VRNVPRRQVIVELAEVLLAIAVGLFFYFHLHQAFGLLLAALAMPAALLNLFLAARSRRRLTDPAARRNQLTGRILAPSPAFARPADGLRTTRWIGAADVPGRMGRMSATMPLGLLELTGGSLTLQVRPVLLSRMYGVRPLEVTPQEVEAIFPARRRIRGTSIGIRPHGQPPYYFLAGSDRAAILTVLGYAGFPVDWSEHKYSYA